MDNNLNLEFSLKPEHEKTCWFCGTKKPAEKNKWATQQLTRPAPSKSYKVESTYEMFTNVPRCKRCFLIHLSKKIFNWIFALMFILPMFITSLPYQLMNIGLSGLVLGFIIYRVVILKVTKPEGYKIKYPTVIELRNQGYKRWWVTMFVRGFQQK